MKTLMKGTESEQQARRAGRPRSAESHQAILEATLVLFAEVGLQGLSIEAIAERAGVGKTTIYRRWSSKEEIVNDALDLMRSAYPLPDTGNIRHDLLSIAREAQDLFNSNPLASKLVIKIMAEIKSRPDVYQAFHEKLVAPRMQQFRQVVEAAQARGELRSDLDGMLILSLIFSSLVYGPLFSGVIASDAQQISEPQLLVDALLRGIGTGQHGQAREESTLEE